MGNSGWNENPPAPRNNLRLRGKSGQVSEPVRVGAYAGLMPPSARLAPELAPPEAIDLYLRLSNRLQADDVPDPESPALNWRETALLVGLVDAWRSHEHRKHIALRHALERAQRRLHE